MCAPRLTLCALLLALCASACSAPPARVAQNFIRQHTACPGGTYADPVVSAGPGEAGDGSEIYYTFYGPSGASIRAVEPDGSNDRLLVDDAAQALPSPDGTVVLFARQNQGNMQVQELHLLDLVSGATRLLVEEGSLPSWSPDGKELAYVQSSQGIGPIALIYVDTGDTTLLTDTPANSALWDTSPMWSPDGKRIAYTSNQETGADIYTITARGGEVARLPIADDPVCSGQVEGVGVEGWLPASDGLVIFHWCGATRNIRLVTLDGEITTTWPIDSPTLQHHLRWSPDGSRFLMWLSEGGGPIVLIADADGSNMQKIPAYANTPTWSGDGQRVIYSGYGSSGYSELFSMAPDGTDQRQITRNPGSGTICLH